MNRRQTSEGRSSQEPYRYRIPPAPPVPGQTTPEPKRQREARRPGRPGRGTLGLVAAGVWLTLLILPALALCRLDDQIAWPISTGALFLVSIFTWQLYRNDKAQAQSGQWRTREATLHLAELAGGWPGAFLAQRRFRHKISKKSYQFYFWCIVTIHQFASLDYLLGWKLLRGLILRF